MIFMLPKLVANEITIRQMILGSFASEANHSSEMLNWNGMTVALEEYAGKNCSKSCFAALLLKTTVGDLAAISLNAS